MLVFEAIAAFFFLAQSPDVAVPIHPGQGPRDGLTWNVRINKHVPISFLLNLPENYGKDKKKRWPLVIFLHGSGERGTDLNAVRRNGPPKEVASGRKFPFILVSPQCPKDQWWDALVLSQLTDLIERRYQIDRNREYVTGLSMGGFGTYDLAVANPRRFAAIASISGGGSMATAFGLGGTPTYIIHGDSDPVVPVDEDRRLQGYLKGQGTEVRYLEVKGGGHDVWTDIYAGNDLYDWLLSHSIARK